MIPILDVITLLSNTLGPQGELWFFRGSSYSAKDSLPDWSCHLKYKNADGDVVEIKRDNRDLEAVILAVHDAFFRIAEQGLPQLALALAAPERSSEHAEEANAVRGAHEGYLVAKPDLDDEIPF